MFKILQATCLTLALTLPAAAQEATTPAPQAAVTKDRAYQISNGQISSPMGVSVQVTSLSVGANSTTIELVASYDGLYDREQAELNGYENSYLSWGDAASDRIFLRRVTGNQTLEIKSGATMRGELVFPGVIPAGIDQVTLVMNPGRDAGHPVQPGLILPLELKN